MLGSPIVSILIPTYRSRLYVKDCLESVARQDYLGRIECVIVDDKGGDDTMDVVNSWIREYRGEIRFNVIEHPYNMGVSQARNTAIENATGDYIYFLDSDDEITDDCISSLAAHIERNTYDIVLAAHDIIGNRQSIPFLKFHDAKELVGREILNSFVREEWTVFPVNKLVRKQFILDNCICFKPGIIHEDVPWAFNLACKAETMYVIPQITYHYYMRDHSITSSDYDSIRISSLAFAWGEINRIVVDNCLYCDSTLSYLNTSMVSFLGRMSSFVSFSKLYLMMRSVHTVPTTKHLFINGANLRWQFRDAHYLLPPVIAQYLEYVFVRMLK